MKLHFLYGTETGNSEMVCEDIEAALDGYEIEITNMGEFDPGAMLPEVFYFIVTSTYGNGDLPSTAAPFAEKLEVNKPDLNGVSFAIFGLGDMVFAETFNHGSKQVMDLMIGLGASMVGERGLYDASTSDLPEDHAIPWAEGVLSQLQAKAA